MTFKQSGQRLDRAQCPRMYNKPLLHARKVLMLVWLMVAVVNQHVYLAKQSVTADHYSDEDHEIHR